MSKTYVLYISATVNQSKQEMTEREASRLQEAIQRQLGYHLTSIATTIRRDPKPGQGDGEAPFFNSLECEITVSSIIQPAPWRI